MNTIVSIFALASIVISVITIYNVEKTTEKIKRLKTSIKVYNKLVNLISLYNKRRMNAGLYPDGLERFSLPDVNEIYESKKYELKDYLSEDDLDILLTERII